MNSPLRLWHPFTNAVLDPKPLRVVKAKGVYRYTGGQRKIVDAILLWWVTFFLRM